MTTVLKAKAHERFIDRQYAFYFYYNVLFKNLHRIVILLSNWTVFQFKINGCFIGKCYLYTDEPEKGLYFFDLVESLLQPDPKTLASLYMDKETIHSRLGNYDEALQCYQKAYEYNPKPEYIFHIAMLYQNRLNDPKSALKNYERFLNLLPDNAEVDSIDWPKDEITVTLESRAKDNIANIKKDLFFDGKMN